MSDIIVGSVGVQLVPSAEGFPEKTKGLLAGLTADVVLKPATEKFRAELEEATRTRAAQVHVDADTAEAEAKIDAAARNRTARINVRSDGLAQASSQTSSLGGGFGTLIGLAGVFGAALVPIGASLTGIAATAGVAGAAVLSVEKTQKKIDQLRATAATTTSKKTAAAATAQADYLESTLNRTQKSFLAAQSGVGVAFRGLLNMIGPDLFRPLTLGLQTISLILPRLAPLIAQVSNYFGGLVSNIAKNVKGGGLDGFLHYSMQVLPQVMGFLGSIVGLLKTLFVGLAPAGSVLIGLLTEIFNIIGSMPAEVIAPLAAALIGLFGGEWIALIAGAVVLFGNLYQSSETVRNALSAFGSQLATNLNPILGSLRDLWNSMLPVLKILGGAIAIVVGAIVLFWSKVAGLVLPIILKIDTAIMNVVAPALKFLASVFLAVVGTIVHGASNAFGWVPLIGGKLKGAANDFDNFAASVNASLAGIDSFKTITLQVRQTVIRAVIGEPTMNLAAGLVGGGIKGGVKPTPTPSFSSGGGFSAPKSGGGGGGKHPKAKVNTAKKEAKKLLAQLAQGILSGGSQLTSALNGILSHIADFPKAFREKLRMLAKDALAQIGKVKALKSAMADLAKSIKDAFSPTNLFEGTLGALRGGLAKALVNVTLAANAQKALLAAGVSASFVAALLASGNGALAAQLAADPALAKDFAAQYDAINKAAGDLGTATAGALYNPQIDKTNAKLADIEKQLTKLAPDIGKVINRAGSKGRG